MHWVQGDRAGSVWAVLEDHMVMGVHTHTHTSRQWCKDCKIPLIQNTLSMSWPNDVVFFTLSLEVLVNNLPMVHDRLRCVSCLGDYFKSKLSARHVYNVGGKVIQGYTALLPHIIWRRFARIGLLLRLAVLRSMAVMFLFGLIYLLVRKP